MRNRPAGKIALGGMLAALAIVIMTLGGVIPVATYVCPLLCVVVCYFVLIYCGKSIALMWYAVVLILCALFAPDKEAVGVFAFFGYYPIFKPFFDKLKSPVAFVLKILYLTLILLFCTCS